MTSAFERRMALATRVADRRRHLCKSAPPCPVCDHAQVQLVNWFVKPAGWKCRMCETPFTYEPAKARSSKARSSRVRVRRHAAPPAEQDRVEVCDVMTRGPVAAAYREFLDARTRRAKAKGEAVEEETIAMMKAAIAAQRAYGRPGNWMPDGRAVEWIPVEIVCFAAEWHEALISSGHYD